MEPLTSFVPPYNIPWATFLSAVERIASDPPRRIDRSYLDSQSGNVQTYLIAALKTFGLIDSDARPTRITDFADPDTRKISMAGLLRENYGSLVALGETKATNDELREEFGKSFPSITGESRVKAIRFFLSGMSYAELPMSDLWASVKAPRGASARGTSRKAGTVRKKPSAAYDTADDGKGGQGGTAGDMRRAYFDLLVEKAKTEQSDDSGLLDRIERLIGVDAPAASRSKVPDDIEGGAS